MSNSNASTPSEPRHSLAPCKLTNGDPAYHSVEELWHAMSLPECKNIALTGIYGSGKSTIVDTFLSMEGTPKNVLRISLSNFCDEEKIPAGEKGENEKKKEEYDNKIEYKIFQHILYKADISQTANSRFKRLRVEEKAEASTIIKSLIITFFCLIIVFEPKFLQVPSFYEAYDYIFGTYGKIVNIIADIVASTILVFIAYHALVYLKRYIRKIEKIKTKDIEVSFSEGKTVFNQLLDEILYFFKAGNYDVVVFEDLDRIPAPQRLFLKLREINILLNESHYYQSSNKTIKFIYAIKDDLFNDEVRTKCFDYIIPVIPVVNNFNAGEYLIANYAAVLDGISAADIKRLGTFITHLRELTNIMNEYMLYKKTIFKAPMSATKLLAMTIYKNLYPNDYSLIHTKGGLLYNYFNNKHIFWQQLIIPKESSVNKLKATIGDKRSNITSCRQSVLKQLQSSDNITKLVIEGIAYTFDEIVATDSLYDKFEHDKVESYIIEGDDPETGNYTYKFNDLCSAAFPDDTYYETISNDTSEILAAANKKRALEKEIFSIKSKTLCELMKLSGDGNASLAIMKQHAHEFYGSSDSKEETIATTLHGLIRGGYISDDYSTYISYTHAGSFSENDFKFQHSVIQGIPLDYDFKLSNIDALIGGIYTDNYFDKSILNFDLLNYLIDKKQSARLDNFIITARRTPDFVIAYDTTQNHRSNFFDLLFNGWQTCVFDIRNIPDNEVRTYMLHLLFRHAPIHINPSADDVEFLAEQYKFIVDDINHCNIPKLEHFYKHHNIIFKQLVEPTQSTKPLFDSVVADNHYAVNYNNLRAIYGPSFDDSSYTTIINGNTDQNLYVSKDINHLVSLFPEKDVNEHPEAMLQLAKHRTITDNNLINLLLRQKQKLTTLTSLDANRTQVIIEADCVEPSWDVVRYAYQQISDKAPLYRYINNHASTLSTESLTDADSELQTHLLCNNDILSSEAYALILKSAHNDISIDDISGLAEERLSQLIDHSLIPYSTEATNSLSAHQPTTFLKYMIQHFDAIIADAADQSFNNSNRLGIEILQSQLTISQKRAYLSNFAFIYSDSDTCDYARQICEFYHTNGFDAIADIPLLVEAIRLYQAQDSWKLKIDLINNVHRTTVYDAERTKIIVDSLGKPYTELNTYASKTSLDANPENQELLQYLISHAPYISKIKPDGNQLKVTYKKAPK